MTQIFPMSSEERGSWRGLKKHGCRGEEKKEQEKTKGISETDRERGRESTEEIKGVAMEKGESSVRVWCASVDRDVKGLETKTLFSGCL